MLFFDGGLGLVLALVWIFCVVDVIMTPEQLCRNLPKLAWVFIVLLFFDLGAVAWLLAGRPWGARTWSPVSGGRHPAARSPQYARPAPPTRATNPDDDEEFLASLRLRAEEQRRRAREAAERERKERDDNPDR